jgi:hypothetical protein
MALPSLLFPKIDVFRNPFSDELLPKGIPFGTLLDKIKKP